MKDGILWHPKAWDEYSKWIVDRNITIAKKIVELTKDISKKLEVSRLSFAKIRTEINSCL